MSNLTDEQLTAIAYEVDDALAEIGLKHNLEPLALCSITLARLIHIAGHSEDIYRLIASVATREHLNPSSRTLQ